MDALYVLSVEQLVSALKTRVESTLNNGQTHSGFSLSSVLAIEEDLSKTLSVVRSIRNTFAPINKLHPELLAYITTFAEAPFGGVADRTDPQKFFCATVCRYWRTSLLAFPGIWSSVDTANGRHMGFYLVRSKKAPLHVNYDGRMTSWYVFEQHIIPEHYRLQSLSITLDQASHHNVTQSLVESAESLRTLDVRMAGEMFCMPATMMERISQFAPNITVLRLHNITTNLSSLEFPALVKLTFGITAPTAQNPDAADLVKFLKRSPILEELDLRLPESFKADAPAGTVELTQLKSTVFNGFSALFKNSISVGVLPYLILPKQSITVDVQTKARAFSPDTSPLHSVIQLGGAVLHQQPITAAAIHIKDDSFGFFGHISICGEHDNWIGVNHIRVLNLGEGPLSRLCKWLDPLSLASLHGIQKLTLGLFAFPSDEEERCMGVLRTSFQKLGQIRVLDVYKVNLSLVTRLLQPSGGVVLFPLLEELKLHPYDPPELTRSVAHDKVQPWLGGKASPLQEEWPRGDDPELLRVRDWRHKLQKALLCTEPIKEEEMPICDEVFKHLEDYDEMTAEHLHFTKIAKVMRHIGNRVGIPRQEEFQFQERAKILVMRWLRLLTAESGDYAKGSDFKESGGMDANSPILHDMMRARRLIVGNVGGLKEVIVKNATGRTILVTLPYS